MPTLTDLEDLLKQKFFYLSEYSDPQTVIDNLISKMRSENGSIVPTKIFTNCPEWAGAKVKIIVGEKLKTFTIEQKSSLMHLQGEIVYFIPAEVSAF